MALTNAATPRPKICPNAAPTARLGTNNPVGAPTPYVHTISPYITKKYKNKASMPNMNVRSPDATSAAPSPTSPKCTRSFNDFASGVKNSWPYREYSPSGQYRRRKNFSRIAFPSSAPYSNGVCAASPRSNRLGDPTAFPAVSLVVSKFPGIFAQGECLRRRNITLAVTTATNTTSKCRFLRCVTGTNFCRNDVIRTFSFTNRAPHKPPSAPRPAKRGTSQKYHQKTRE
mmetsp:Transcript_4060/g.14906  ORF Transcript_4060/g.14906 Transcript_4060/m.14906 type:complete len:229 (-) Transcript_4060:1130-1816(-)